MFHQPFLVYFLFNNIAMSLKRIMRPSSQGEEPRMGLCPECQGNFLPFFCRTAWPCVPSFESMSPFWILLFQVPNQIAMGCLGGRYILICPPPPSALEHRITAIWNNRIQNGCGITKKVYFLLPMNVKVILDRYTMRMKTKGTRGYIILRIIYHCAGWHQNFQIIISGFLTIGLDSGTQSEQITSFWMKENLHTIAKFLHGSSLTECSWRSGKFREQHAVAECESCC